MLFIGVVNHWIAFVVRKKGIKGKLSRQQDPYRAGKKFDNKFYLMDSSNYQHLSKTEIEVPNLIMSRVHERIRLGLRASSKF